MGAARAPRTGSGRARPITRLTPRHTSCGVAAASSRTNVSGVCRAPAAVACLDGESTSNVLTATTLIYASGAGITAAAGTRLALHLILIEGFMLNSFQLWTIVREVHIVISRHYLPVPGLAISQAPSPESNPDSPLPVATMVVLYTTINS
uniref:Uncharacterized protein n=1 Tax=Anopheles stephensi TaxID=30069 RepID=A0A182YTE7_ANOST